jgi:antitoxin component HigA of HigAB toxin-antitoxin module
MNSTLCHQATLPDPIPTQYEELCAHHMPRRIHDEVEFANTSEIVSALAVFDKLTPGQQDYLDILTDQIEEYEKATLPKPRKISGLSTLKFLMREHGMNAAALGKIIGVDRSDAYKIVRGERSLSVQHLRSLSHHFAVSADAFL